MKIMLANKNCERTRTKYLWFPKRIKNEIRWLEKATWTETYDLRYPLSKPNGPGDWLAREWIDNDCNNPKRN